MKPTDKVSKYFTYGELFASDTAKRLGIDNTPTPEHLENLIWYAKNIGDPLREFVGGPLHIGFYRSKALNDVVPGAADPSFHSFGMAGDADCDTYGHGNNKEMFDWARKNLTFAQIIWEYGTTNNPDWVHITGFAPHIKGLSLRHDEKKATRFFWDKTDPKKPVRKKCVFDLY